ncbi:MAG TPA: MlaD family protein [Rhizomicrobium sp.]|nr:MlaD family protein [Rhizomicrobium sp.]
METKANYVAVGAFMLAGLFGLVIALLWLAGAQYREEYAYYRTYFTGPVTGLGKGTAVRYNGIDVGRVSKLDFDPENPKRVIVTMQLQPSLAIHDDSVASIASVGLTGGTYVEIDGGSKKAPVLAPGPEGEIPVIRAKPSTLQELEESAPQLAAKLSKIEGELDDLLNEKNRRAFAEVLDHMRNLSADLDKRSPDIDRALKNIATASDSLNGDLVDLHRVLGHADGTVQRIDHVASDLDTQVTGAQLAQFVSQSKALVQSLTALSNKLDHEPTQLIFGDRRKGYTPP